MKRFYSPLTLLLSTALAACTVMNPYHMRADGKVLQIHSIRHVKSGRMMNDGAIVGATNAAQISTQLGAGTGTSMAAGGILLALSRAMDAAADDDEYVVTGMLPGDVIKNLLPGYPAQPREYQLGVFKFTSVMNDVRRGDWVKIVEVNGKYTLIPCGLPAAQCDAKIAEHLARAKSQEPK